MSNQKLNNLKELLKKLKQDKGRCFIDSCGRKSIGSHTISKSRILEKLQENDEKLGVILLHLEDKTNVDFKHRTLSTYQNSERRLIKKGKSSASVFYGFCVKHDANLFQELDNETYSNTDKINFLHAYRGFALYVTKSNDQFSFLQNKILENSIRVENPRTEDLNQGLEKVSHVMDQIDDNLQMQAQKTTSWIDKIRVLIQKDIVVDETELRKSINRQLSQLNEDILFPIPGYVFKKKIKKIIDAAYLKIGVPEKRIPELENIVNHRIKENRRIKSIFNSAVLKKNYNVIDYVSRPIDGIYNITGNFVFCNSRKELFSLTFFPEFETKKTQVIIASLEDRQETLNQLKTIDVLEYKKLLSSIIIHQGTNVFMSPSFFDQLDEEIQKEMVSEKSTSNLRILNIFK
ncbi:MAG: hypothetical protein PHQ74_03365 [Crocinitomicaceae bacterium]|nr:hypothetical protein [Crocinitomicaceae bacterium]